MLLRNGSNNAVVRGQIYNLVKTVQKIDKLTQKSTTHYIPVLKKSKNIKNLRVTIDDGFTKQTRRVKADGKFTFSKFNMGDISVIIDGEKEEEVKNDEINTTSTVRLFEENLTISSEDNDLGNFYVPETIANNESEENEPVERVTPTHNFKTMKVIDVQDKDDRYMYENRTYKGKLVFKNTGETIATALNYSITTNDQYVESITHDIIMGSVDVNQSVEIPFEVTFRMLDKIKHHVELDFIIRDVNGNEWLDNAYLDVYQTPVWVNLKTKSSKLKGYFVTPEHEVIDIDTSDIRVKLPVRPDANYYFVVSSPENIDTETAYSIGIDVNASEFEDFHDTSAFEPNNTEEKAKKIEVGDSIKSFIHKGDIDFFSIKFKENISFTPPPLPFN
ncbi:hypothetical protein MNB_SV-14-137 [hydrothermal vent metagenome]|uniref:Uncharacterized protein n=1 Tax=hydrothermal vent metagenome TaxID=652676 RepID=A0A1W1CMW1_9ZZZZ